MTTKTSKVSLFCLIFLLALMTVQTAIADLSLTGNAVEFDFGELEDRDDSLAKSHSITIFNNGSTNESVTLSVISTNDLFSVELDDISDSSFDLTSGASRTVILLVTAKVSDGVNPGEYGDVIRVTATGSSTSVMNLNTSVDSMLDLDRIVFYLDDRFESRMDQADENDEDEDVVATPGQTVKMYFLLENLFDNNFDDGDIDGTITVTLDDNDFGEDIDEEVDFDITSGDETSEGGEVYVEFDVPVFAKDELFDVVIEVDASDENGADYDFEWIAELSVEREDDDVRIESLEVSPSSVSCSRSVTVDVELINYGSDRQRNSRLTLENSDLDLFLEESFSLGYGYDEDENSEDVEFTFEVPESQSKGIYQLKARAYYNNDDTGDLKTIDLRVDNCKVSVKPEPKTTVENTPVEVVTTEVPTTAPTTTSAESSQNTQYKNAITGSAIVNTVEKVYTTQDVMVALLVTLFLLVVAIIVLTAIVGVKFLVRK